MKILLTTFFIENINNHPLSAFADHYGRWLLDPMSDKNIDVKFLICEDIFQENKKVQKLDYLNLVPYTKKEVEKIFPNTSFEELYTKVCLRDLPTEKIDELAEFFRKKLNGWTPDIIFSKGYFDMGRVLQRIYPHALTFSCENAIFSRPPFGRTLSYDPFNTIPNNFLVKFAEDIRNFPITSKQNKKIEKLKSSIRSLINKSSPLDQEIKHYKKKFKKLVLLPLIWKGHIALFEDCIYKTEKELINAVMQNVPADVGVFVTQADAFASLTDEDIAHFKTKYPNFIFLQQTNRQGYANNSLHYFKYIDAVLNLTSKTGFMAMIWDIPVLSLAKTYNKWYQDADDIKELPQLLSQPVKNKNNVLYWYFTRYVLFEQDILKEDFLWNFFTDKLNAFKKEGITFNFYNEINDIKKVSNYILYPIQKKPENTIYSNSLFTIYKTSNGININLFGLIKTRIWKIKK